MTQAASAHVAVIGGGCAGLAAAAKLAEAGIKTILFEASQTLGGRARGVNWNGQQLDNGQHILLGAYSETLTLLRLAGVNLDEALLRLPLHLLVPGNFELRARGLPAPLHILFGLLHAQGLAFAERMAVIRLIAWARLLNFKLPVDEPLQQLLKRKAQPEKAVKLLWEPLCLAALNTPLATASAQVFLHVLRDSFAGARHASDMLLPRRDLSAVLADPCAQYIQRQGGDIRLGTAITRITQSDTGFLLHAHDEACGEFSQVIVAVPPFRLGELLADMPELAQTMDLCRQFDYQPIYTIYLQYASGARLPAPMIALADTRYSQWLFDRGQLCEQQGLIAVIISAEGEHQRLTQQDLAAAVAQEVALAFPSFTAPLWHKVIAEKRATFACTYDVIRPESPTAICGLYLAGDYTAGDYPATIEAAVRSGANCARHVMAELDCA